jgi:hypothetical protein
MEKWALESIVKLHFTKRATVFDIHIALQQETVGGRFSFHYTLDVHKWMQPNFQGV